jgi:hypothetical protein
MHELHGFWHFWHFLIFSSIWLTDERRRRAAMPGLFGHDLSSREVFSVYPMNLPSKQTGLAPLSCAMGDPSPEIRTKIKIRIH